MHSGLSRQRRRGILMIIEGFEEAHTRRRPPANGRATHYYIFGGVREA